MYFDNYIEVSRLEQAHMRTPVYIGRALIPKMVVLSGRWQVIFVRIGPGLSSNFENLSGLLDQASFWPKFVRISGSGLSCRQNMV